MKKPKRPARKRKTAKTPFELWCDSAARWKKCAANLEEKLTAAEADKRILLDEVIILRADIENVWKAKQILYCTREYHSQLMLDALCHGFEHVQEYHVAEQRNSRQWKIEHDAVLAERDTLAKRNQELELQLRGYKEYCRISTRRTMCQMGFSESKGVKA